MMFFSPRDPIKSLKKIGTGTIEGDALELSKRNGRIAAIEDILLAQRDAYDGLNKIKKINVHKTNDKKNSLK